MDSVTVDYQRQQALNLELPEAVAVVGCGGVGSWTAYFLALAGVKKLFLFDSDTVSETNLNRIPLPASAIGQIKSAAVADMIRAIRPQCMIYSLGMFTSELADQLGLKREIQWIVATTDTMKSRQLVEEWSQRAYSYDIKYIEAAAEGDYGSATGVAADWSTPDETNPGYASVPVWCSPCVLSAMIACNQIVHNAPMGDRTIRLGFADGRFDIFDSEVETVEQEEDDEEEMERTPF